MYFDTKNYLKSNHNHTAIQTRNDSGSQVHGRTKNLKNFCIKRGESTQVREEEVDLQMKAEMFTNEITSIWVNFKNTCQILLTYLDNGRFRFY
jgi:hypothetical protein